MTGPVLSVIGGEERPGTAALTVDDPFDGSAAAQVSGADERMVENAARLAATAARTMQRLPAWEKAEILTRVAQRMRSEAALLRDSIVRCTGKTVTESQAEVDRAPDILLLSAEEGRRISAVCPPADAIRPGSNKFAILLREPVGVVASITPFNAPLNSFCHKVGPAFAAGNAIVAKPDLRGAAVATLMAKWFHEAGAPAGSLNVVHGDASVGQALVAQPEIDFIGFTGSTRAALDIQKMSGLRRTQFELGGNAATIIHKDADWRPVLPALVRAAFGLSGQSCISLQRLFVHRDLFDTVVEAFGTAAASLRLGDPKDKATDIGPVVNAFHAARICSWAEEAIEEGAQLVAGGDHDGALVRPTILVGTKPSARTMREEVFGPLVNIASYTDIQEAFDLVNASRFGLQASVLTGSLTIALDAARSLRTGGVVINGPSRQRLDNLPYGGRGESGLGREGPAFAIQEMTELKTVVVNQ